MPHQLVSLLRDVSTELETLGHHAADQAAEARATALSITLEAVKAELPQTLSLGDFELLRLLGTLHSGYLSYFGQVASATHKESFGFHEHVT